MPSCRRPGQRRSTPPPWTRDRIITLCSATAPDMRSSGFCTHRSLYSDTYCDQNINMEPGAGRSPLSRTKPLRTDTIGGPCVSSSSGLLLPRNPSPTSDSILQVASHRLFHLLSPLGRSTMHLPACMSYELTKGRMPLLPSDREIPNEHRSCHNT